MEPTVPKVDPIPVADTSKKSIFSLSIEEYQLMVDTNIFPPNLDWSEMMGRPDFERVFKLRTEPAQLAKYLMPKEVKNLFKAKPGPKVDVHTTREYKYVGVTTEAQKQERLDLKKRELEIKALKVDQLSKLALEMNDMNKNFKVLNHKMDTMDKTLKTLVRLMLS